MNNLAFETQLKPPPESIGYIKHEAEKILKKAKAIGVYPTPVDEIIEASGVKQIDNFDEMKYHFINTAPAALVK